jgi:hypothetical protein
VVLWGREAAFLVNGRWRHANDLTDEELQELRFIGLGTGAARAADRARHYTRPLPHEILELIAQKARDVRKDGTTIVGEIGETLMERVQIERYVRDGTPLGGDRQTSVLGLPTRTTARSRPTPQDRNSSIAFLVWLDAGKISEFALEFRLFGAMPSANDPSAPQAMTETVKIKLLDVGTTKVAIDPQARAVFLSAPADR